MDKNDESYQMGISTGEWMERERIITLLEDYSYDETMSWNDLLRRINGEN